MPGDRPADCRGSGQLVEDRRVRFEQDDAAQRARAVERALRPLEDLDRLHIDQLQVRVGSAVAGTHVAEILANR